MNTNEAVFEAIKSQVAFTALTSFKTGEFYEKPISVNQRAGLLLIGSNTERELHKGPLVEILKDAKTINPRFAVVVCLQNGDRLARVEWEELCDIFGL